MSKKLCIYCSPDQSIQVPFTREHIIPQAFGKFKKNLVLNEGVCCECNKFFGDNLELFLGRGSLESLLRLNYKIKPPEDISKIHKDRLRVALSAEDEHDGLILEYQFVDDDIVVVLIPQVGFPRLNGSGWVYIAESDLADLTKPLATGIDARGPDILLIFDSEETKQRLIQILAGRNIKNPEISEKKLPFESGQRVEAVAKSTIDSVILRCIAKISFNYLAKIASIDFVVKQDFNPVRSYIRYGTESGYQVVKISRTPILANDGPRSQRQTNGHLITAGWSPDNRDIVGLVSLFNQVTYQITLSKNFSGIWRADIRRGHHFNIETREVEPLNVVSRAFYLVH